MRWSDFAALLLLSPFIYLVVFSTLLMETKSVKAAFKITFDLEDEA